MLLFCARRTGYPTVEFLLNQLQLSLLYSSFFYYFCFNYFGFALKASNPLDSSSHSSPSLSFFLLPGLCLSLLLFCHSKSFSSAVQCCFLLCLAAHKRRGREREGMRDRERERGCFDSGELRCLYSILYSIFICTSLTA